MFLYNEINTFFSFKLFSWKKQAPNLALPLWSLQDVGLVAQRAEELEASLGRLQRECSQAVAAAQAVVGRPSTPRGSPRSSQDGAGGANVEDVVRQLVTKLKVGCSCLCNCSPTLTLGKRCSNAWAHIY